MKKMFTYLCVLLAFLGLFAGCDGAVASHEEVVTMVFVVSHPISRAVDDSSIEVTNTPAELAQTRLVFLDASGAEIVSRTIIGGEYNTRIEIEFTLDQVLAIRQLRLENSWLIGTVTQITTKTYPLTIGEGYNVIRISVGNFWAVDVIVETDKPIADWPLLDLRADNEIIRNEATFDFGHVDSGSSRTVSFTMKNSGKADLVVSNISLISPESGRFALSAAAGTIPSEGSATFTITYTGTVTGTMTDVIRIDSNDINYPTLRFTVRAVTRKLVTNFREFSSTTAQPFTVPDLSDITVQVMLVGAGAGGNGGFGGPGGSGPGLGGGAGAVYNYIFAAYAGQVLAVTAGTGGAGGAPGTTAGSPGGVGGASTITGTSIAMSAPGGIPGVSSTQVGLMNDTPYGKGGDGGASGQAGKTGANGFVRILWTGYDD